MTTVGFIGLGIMGAPMARNLVAAGYQVIGYNRSEAKVASLVEAGGIAAASIKEATESADAVVTMLPDSPDVEEVVLGDGGVLDSASPGMLLVDCSTVRPETARKVADCGREPGVRVLDAPVSGGEQGAIDGILSIMVGGTAEDFDYALPILQAMGSTVVHVGPHGAGQTVKAANQLVVAGVIELVSEAIVFLEAQDVDSEVALRVLAGGLAGNAVIERKGAAMVARQFDPGFRLALHHKDLGILRDAARDVGVQMPLGALVAELVAAMVARGDGDLDHSALLKLVSDLSGRSA